MSASTIRSTVRAGEAVMQEAARRREAFLRDRRGSGQRSSGQDRAALNARFQSFAEFAPAEIREELKGMFEGGVGLADLESGVERVEAAAADRFESRQVCELRFTQLAEESGGSFSGVRWAGRKMEALFQFPDRGEMGALLSEGDDGDLVLDWLARNSTFVNRSEAENCADQYGAVKEVADAVEGMEVQTDPPPPPPAAESAEEPRRSSWGAG